MYRVHSTRSGAQCTGSTPRCVGLVYRIHNTRCGAQCTGYTVYPVHASRCEALYTRGATRSGDGALKQWGVNAHPMESKRANKTPNPERVGRCECSAIYHRV